MIELVKNGRFRYDPRDDLPRPLICGPETEKVTEVTSENVLPFDPPLGF